MGKRIIIVGAGAAGCFCAIEVKRLHPEFQVTVFEALPRPLAKVSITGGGRCNLTNTFSGVARLENVYPRGFRLMRRVFSHFSPEETVRWWENEGVSLVVQDDGCIFPLSQDAMQIVGTLTRLMQETGVTVCCNTKVTKIARNNGKFTVGLADGRTEESDIVIFTVGGNSSTLLRSILPDEVGITATVPSLFTLKIGDEGLRALMGTVVEDVSLSIAGTRFSSEGTLLITDWGISGPATLRLSSYAAPYLAEALYKCNLSINWLNKSENEIREWLARTIASNGRKTLQNIHPGQLSARLWNHVLERCCLRHDMRWSEIGSKGLARLVSELSSAVYPVCGRARFKEEFVTCGGVDLRKVDWATLECKDVPGLYFAGEVLDIDAVTGGFNLQAAWSTAMVIADNVAK